MRSCKMCKADITYRKGNAKYCEVCANRRQTHRIVEYQRQRYKSDPEYRKRRREYQKKSDELKRRKYAKMEKLIQKITPEQKKQLDKASVPV